MEKYLEFFQGSLKIVFPDDLVEKFLDPKIRIYDKKLKCFRALAYKFRAITRTFTLGNIKFDNKAIRYEAIDSLKFNNQPDPYDYQTEALKVWTKAKWGTVVLPTGSGKTFVAALAIKEVSKSALIVVPTIDLLLQWHKVLQEIFGMEIGIIGGNQYEIKPITVITYDSAGIYYSNIGNRFCLIIFDECHNLTGTAYSEAARGFISPYRLGLTATPPDDDVNRLEILQDVAGPIVFRKEITDLSGDFLSPYEVRTVHVEMNRAEEEEYLQNRQIYLDFRQKMMQWGLVNADRWESFVFQAGKTAEGRKALKAHRRQREISMNAEAKFEVLLKIIKRHRGEKILIFTNDNSTAFKISTIFLIPLITHETGAGERKKILTKFRSGDWPILASSRVLNEGVDVPDASVGIVLSGTGTVREHVQRLGRILRKRGDKQAVFYEIICRNTSEEYSSKKRRQHSAYGFFN